MESITPAEVHDRLQTDPENIVIADIRSEHEFANWHIPGSVNVPVYDSLRDDPSTVWDILANLPAGKSIVTVCAAGVVSQTAAELLRDMGYDATSLVNGLRGWNQLHVHAKVDSDIDGTLLQVGRPGKGCLSHILISQGEAAVFDPSRYIAEYSAIIEARRAELVSVFDSHVHADHLSGGLKLAKRHDTTYHLHPDHGEIAEAERIRDGDRLTVGTVHVDVIHTPGHSPGGVTYLLDEAAILTGDTLFLESVGRVELGIEAGLEETAVESNAERLFESIQRIRERASGDALVLPAHAPSSPTPPVTAKLEEVERENPDLLRDRHEFIQQLSSDVPEHPRNFQRIKAANAGLLSIDEEEQAQLEQGPNRCAAN